PSAEVEHPFVGKGDLGLDLGLDHVPGEPEAALDILAAVTAEDFHAERRSLGGGETGGGGEQPEQRPFHRRGCWKIHAVAARPAYDGTAAGHLGVPSSGVNRGVTAGQESFTPGNDGLPAASRPVAGLKLSGF